MPNFTRPDGSSISVAATSVVRARPSLSNEISGHPGHDGAAMFKPKQLVLESIDVVGSALQAENGRFAVLHAPNGAGIWFDASKASDAEPPRSTETSPTTNSVVLMGGVRQRLSETVSQAQAVINAARIGA